MDFIINNMIEALKIISGVAIFFVWVVRYDNIIKEFRDDYNLPDWLRDLVGIIKLSCAGMLLTKDTQLQIVALISIAFLMCAAVATHIRVKNPTHKMLPAITLLTICLTILFLVF